jgi:hypothetical protein
MCRGLRFARKRAGGHRLALAGARLNLPEQEVKKEKEQVPPMGITHSNALLL